MKTSQPPLFLPEPTPIIATESSSPPGTTVTQSQTRRRRKNLPFEVIMDFRDENMPSWRQREETEDLAATTMRHWLATIAGIKSIVIADYPGRQKHIFTPGAGYLFTVPILD